MKKKCPYCDSIAVLIDSIQVYKVRSYGPMWACSRYPVCDSYVGCHPGTEKPLGDLANKELRDARGSAHTIFDPLWMKKSAVQRCSKGQARRAGYRWLAKELGIPFEKCHIAMFDVDTCRRVVELCRAITARKKIIKVLRGG